MLFDNFLNPQIFNYKAKCESRVLRNIKNKPQSITNMTT